MTPERNLLSYLPTAIKHYPDYAATGSQAAHQALLDVGIPPGSGLTWEYSYRTFWDPLQRILREEVDPTYDGDALAGHPFCAPGSADCDADYDLEARPQAVKDAIARISLTGKIGKPLIMLQGSLDTAVTPRDTRPYATMIKDQGRGKMSRLYEIEGGTHFEGLYGSHPTVLRPMLPCFRGAFDALEEWTTNGTQPPSSHFVPRDASSDLVNTCDIRG